jgi:hypothetical protein
MLGVLKQQWDNTPHAFMSFSAQACSLLLKLTAENALAQPSLYLLFSKGNQHLVCLGFEGT